MNKKHVFIGLMLLVCGSAAAQDRAEVEFQTCSTRLLSIVITS